MEISRIDEIVSNIHSTIDILHKNLEFYTSEYSQRKDVFPDDLSNNANILPSEYLWDILDSIPNDLFDNETGKLSAIVLVANYRVKKSKLKLLMNMKPPYSPGDLKDDCAVVIELLDELRNEIKDRASLVQAASPQAASPQAASPQAASPQADPPQAASPQAASPQAASLKKIPDHPKQQEEKFWTDKERAILASLFHAGLCQKEIAKQIKCSISTVKRYLSPKQPLITYGIVKKRGKSEYYRPDAKPENIPS